MYSLSAAYVFCASTAVVILFQIALSAGAPWGRLAMGGRYPGRFPARLRIAAVIQAIVLAWFMAVVLSRARIWSDYFMLADSLIWLVVGISALSLIMNLITPSKWERILWAPIACLMAASSLIVALAW